MEYSFISFEKNESSLSSNFAGVSYSAILPVLAHEQKKNEVMVELAMFCAKLLVALLSIIPSHVHLSCSSRHFHQF